MNTLAYFYNPEAAATILRLLGLTCCDLGGRAEKGADLIWTKFGPSGRAGRAASRYRHMPGSCQQNNIRLKKTIKTIQTNSTLFLSN